MPRIARERSGTGMYHVIMRGINRQIIFLDDEDRERYLFTIEKYKISGGFELYGYCLMNNHVHLLIKEKGEALSSLIKRLSCSFVYWYNRKYNRCGHLFQERYKSKPIKDEVQLLTVLRYIHQNPVKAGICKRVEKYPWSSCSEYIREPLITDTEFILGNMSKDKERAKELFIEYNNKENNDVCMEFEADSAMTDGEVRKIIRGFGIDKTSRLRDLDISKRNEILARLKEMGQIPIRQISRVTGLSKSLIGNMKKR